MPGGLMNLISAGNQNIILNGNPSKTFFTSTYSKYTNFGLQKFRIDFKGQRTLRMTQPSVFDFKVPRYAELLMDTYLVVNLPNIWSPVVPPSCDTVPENSPSSTWQPYEFKWIENLGSQMIETIRFRVGGQVVQEITGQYLYNMVERDFSATKKRLFYKMTGNIPELNDPANANGRINIYPSVFYGTGEEFEKVGPEPSIRGRQLYIPLNAWFTMASKMAFPLVSLQYDSLYIEVTLKPINELFVVRYIGGGTVEESAGYYHKTDQSNPTYGFYKFLQPPPGVDLAESNYPDVRTNWDADIHLLSTYAFLSEDEARLFASKPQKYLIKEVYTTLYENIVGSKRIDLKSIGLVSSWMWFFQRSDVALRNEWSNYTNWPYKSLPYNVSVADSGNSAPQICGGTSYYPDKDKFGNFTGLLTTGTYKPMNKKDIMQQWALLIDGKFRENELDAGILNYVEKYTRTAGNAKSGLYCYNFCLNTDPLTLQPSGAFNTSKNNLIEFEVKTIHPSLDPNAQFRTICDDDGNIIGTVKPVWGLFDYTYNMIVMEERFNVLEFHNGSAGLKYAR